MSGESARERLLTHLVNTGTGQVLAVGWASVDLDRATAEVAASLGMSAGDFADAADCIFLGARCRLAADALDPEVSVILMEPFNEGRLAAALARHDEGPIAIWRPAAPGGSGPADLSAAQAGPMGPERLELASPIHGPYRLVVGTPGTIKA